VSATLPTGKGSDNNAGREDARVMHLADAHKIVGDICTMAEPLFDTGCPLVLYNRLAPGDMCFLPRDTFSCSLFALVYRAGTRILRGDCVMTAEMVKGETKTKLNTNLVGDGDSDRAAAAAGKSRPSKAGSEKSNMHMRVVGDDANGTDPDAAIFDTAEDGFNLASRRHSASEVSQAGAYNRPLYKP
jgi:hypothetical protein